MNSDLKTEPADESGNITNEDKESSSNESKVTKTISDLNHEDFSQTLICTKKIKLELNDNLATSDIININHYLNNASLLHIFEYLPLREKLTVELVCKRWRNLKEFLWIENKSFEISQRMISLIERADKISFDRREKENFIFNVLQRAGPYLNHLTVMNDIKCYPDLFKEITRRCQNLTNLYLEKKRSTLDCDEDLANLFSNNQKISCISFDKMRVNGSCLSKLNADLIKEIHIRDCTFYKKVYLYDFFSKLKNLNILKLLLTSDSYELITALNKSTCESIREIRVEPYINGVQLAQFIAKQKNLQKLIGSYKKELLDILPVDLFQEMELNINNSNSQSLSRFENLINIDCVILCLNDEILKNLSKCFHVKKLCISVTTVRLTIEGEKNFGLFKNLESLQIICNDENTERMFNAVAYCINLKELIINPRKRNMLRFIKLITNCIHLEKLKLYGQCNFSNFFYENVNDLKTKRGDTHILEFLFHKTCSYSVPIEKELIKKLLPLISLKFGQFFQYNKIIK